MRSGGNKFKNNSIIGGTENPVELPGDVHVSVYSSGNWRTVSDSGFIDLAKNNFRLKAGSEVFQKIPGL